MSKANECITALKNFNSLTDIIEGEISEENWESARDMSGKLRNSLKSISDQCEVRLEVSSLLEKSLEGFFEAENEIAASNVIAGLRDVTLEQTIEKVDV